MLSPNKHNPQFVFQMMESTARGRALSLLNESRPEHPPDIYFIRRNEKLLDKYLDQEEMDQLIKVVDPKFRPNYTLFKLDPLEV